MKVEIYGASWCQPCQRSKQLCIEKGLDYTFKDVTINPHDRIECEERLGHKVDTVPQIFVDGKYVGGADAFRSLING